MLRKSTIVGPAPKTVEGRDLAEEAAAWEFALTLYRECLVQLGVDGEGLDRVFAGNAREFYGL